MKKQTFIFTFLIIVANGCARVMVEAPKEPIKVDISMRLDIYQHVQQDIDKIEDIVAGEKNNDDSSRNFNLLRYAYAEENLSPEVKEAALRRHARLAELIKYQQRGIIGENISGFTEIRDPSAADQNARQLVSNENKDRTMIYNAVAKKNNASLENVKALYAARLQNNAPSGTPIETYNEKTKRYEWLVK